MLRAFAPLVSVCADIVEVREERCLAMACLRVLGLE